MPRVEFHRAASSGLCCFSLHQRHGIYLFADDAKLYSNITPTRPSAIIGDIVRGKAAAIQRETDRYPSPELRDMDYEDRLRALKLPSLYYRRARGDIIEAYKFTHSIYKTEQDPKQRKTNTTTRGHRVTWGKASPFGDDLSLTYLFASTS